MQGDLVAPQRRGLGKGLGALIPETAPSRGVPSAGSSGPSPQTTGAFSAALADPSAGISGAPDNGPVHQEVAGAYFAEVEVGAITPNSRQPRLTFDEDALEELAASIA